MAPLRREISLSPKIADTGHSEAHNPQSMQWLGIKSAIDPLLQIRFSDGRRMDAIYGATTRHAVSFTPYARLGNHEKPLGSFVEVEELSRGIEPSFQYIMRSVIIPFRVMAINLHHFGCIRNGSHEAWQRVRQRLLPDDLPASGPLSRSSCWSNRSAFS